MRRWGIIISVAYALIVVGFLVPSGCLLTGLGFMCWPWLEDPEDPLLALWINWGPILVLVFGQALLLFLSVDTSHKRLKPRAHILISCTVTGILFGLLTIAAAWSLVAGVYGDRGGPDKVLGVDTFLIALWAWGLLWLCWAMVFYVFFRKSSQWITKATSWLLKGSVLELLVAVPCHVIVRRRDDCSAPIATSFGITTGIAIMLLSFGPGVLFLYKKRLDAYARPGSAARG